MLECSQADSMTLQSFNETFGGETPPSISRLATESLLKKVQEFLRTNQESVNRRSLENFIKQAEKHTHGSLAKYYSSHEEMCNGIQFLKQNLSQSS